MEYIWICVIIWVICALTGGGITSSRGESFLSGFLIGLFLGIIGIFFSSKVVAENGSR